MSKQFINLILFCAISTAAFSQANPTADEEKNMKVLAETPEGWTKKGTINLGGTLSLFSNWAAGGINSLGANALLDYRANYRKGKNAWDNQFFLAYGTLNQGFATSQSWVKTDDRIDITSKYGRKFEDKLYYAALLNFQTQFYQGFATDADGRLDRTKRISNLMAPGRLLFSLGVDYKPNADLSIFVSPITYRGIFVLDQYLADQGAFGVKNQVVLDSAGVAHPIAGSGEHIRTEVGAYLRINYAHKFNDNLSYTSTFELFSNYLEKPENVDLNWQNLVAWKVGKYFAFTFMVQLLYDDNTTIYKLVKVDDPTSDDPAVTMRVQSPSKGLQIRSLTTVGLTYNF